MAVTQQLAARASTRAAGDTTRTLLACGIVAGPGFVLVALVQSVTREGFDLRRHPFSLLSVGDLGWIQIANFVVAGLLTLGFAVGVRRALVRDGRRPARTWGPLLLGLYGLGLIAGGAFVPDPAMGYPPGTPDGIPDQMSWHAAAHGVAPVVAFNAAVLATFVFVRRFVVLRQRWWAVYSGVSGLAAIALTAWPGIEGISVRLALAVAVTSAWTAALAVHLRRRSTIHQRAAV
jgi:hypothetical protein